jgi:hypothetical protein
MGINHLHGCVKIMSELLILRLLSGTRRACETRAEGCSLCVLHSQLSERFLQARYVPRAVQRSTLHVQ